jgi:ABC-type cobalt transport system substrate-binding protein
LDGKKIKKYVTYFLGELKPWFEKFIKPQEGEITDIKLIPAEQVEKYIKFASLKKIFKKALDYLTNYRKWRLL